jgi:uncharacterized protein YggE
MRRFLVLLFPLLAAAPAFAQTALTISATGTASATPDEAVASFTVQASAPAAAAAQAEVNAAMSKALAAARAVPGVTVTTGGYSCNQQALYQPNQQIKVVYAASQSLSLTLSAAGGVPPARFAALLAQLQQQGLLMNNLGADLSSVAMQTLQQQANADALTQVQAQAAALAAQLHEHVGTMKTLNVSVEQVAPRGPMLEMAATDAAPPPQSAPDNITATASVTAEIDLTP